MRHFNTAGPCDPRFHYMVPPLARLPQAPRLIDQGGYFVLHAPRQTGKTTTLRALAKSLTAEGRYAALWFSCERAEPAQEDYVAAQRAVLTAMAQAAERDLAVDLRPPAAGPELDGLSLLSGALSAWARSCPRPLVLFFDEIDSLRGESLRAVLRQLRDGYVNRPDDAPWSVVLCGLRDVRDYRAAAGGEPSDGTERLGTSSPFNIKIASLRLGDLTPEELGALYAQHTAETGQAFTDEALARAFEVGRGQPWLTNALAREVVEEMGVATQAIDVSHIDAAKERLILARATHLDSLVARLHEPRVKRVIEPILAGDLLDIDAAYKDDLRYVHDLGLVTSQRPPAIANPIYREVIARVLAGGVETTLVLPSRSWTLADGRLDLPGLLAAFLEFWREHGELLSGGLGYHEVAPQLVLMAFLQRVVNGGGYIDREYGVGRKRIDLLIRWPYGSAGQRAWQREAIELKVWRPKQRDPLEDGLAQLESYLARLGLMEGTLVIFDRRVEAAAVEERMGAEVVETVGGRRVRVVRA